MGIVHSPFFVRGTLATSSLLWRMFTSSLLNGATHPESHNFLIDKRDPVLRDGNKCAWRAARGRLLIGMMPICVDAMQLPSGICMWMGLVSGWMLLHGLSVLKKWPLHHVSAIACGIGGRYGGEDLNIALSNELLIFKLFCLFDEAFLGIPPVQVVSQQNVMPPN